MPPLTLRSACGLFLAAILSGCSPSFEPLFNGRDLSGWRIINTDESTWTVRNGMIITSGKPIGELCTTRQYENFVLEVEWRHMVEGGNAGLFVHSDPLPAVGQPFTRAIEAQVMDGNHGDVFSIHGATMIPDRPHPEGWMRSLPIEHRANPTGEWNHYRLESRDGTISLAVNGAVVSGGTEVNPRKGYICLESEGSEAHFRNLRIFELPSTNPSPRETASTYDGFRTLYTGVDLSGWETETPRAWVVDDWMLHARAGDGAPLWTTERFIDYELVVDFRLECDDGPSSGAVLLRGDDGPRVGLTCSDGRRLEEGRTLATATEAGADRRGWQRLLARVNGPRVTVWVGDEELYDGDVTARGPAAIGLQHTGTDITFSNLFVKKLD